MKNHKDLIRRTAQVVGSVVGLAAISLGYQYLQKLNEIPVCKANIGERVSLHNNEKISLAGEDYYWRTLPAATIIQDDIAKYYWFGSTQDYFSSTSSTDPNDSLADRKGIPIEGYLYVKENDQGDSVISEYSGSNPEYLIARCNKHDFKFVPYREYTSWMEQNPIPVPTSPTLESTSTPIITLP